MVKQIVTDADGSITAWIAERVECEISTKAVAFGIVEDGKLIGGYAFYNQRGHDVEAAIAAEKPRWANRQIALHMVNTPFVDLEGVERVTAIIKSSNLQARRFVEKLGYRQEGLMRQACQNKEDAIMYGFIRDDLVNNKWSLDYGKEKGAKAA
jgi:RimJ/RimL family protein N-acetyltransferase